MKATLVSLLVVTASALAAAESIHVGMSEAKLLELKGPPPAKAVSGDKAIYRWPDMQVKLIGGKIDHVQIRDVRTEERRAAERALTEMKRKESTSSIIVAVGGKKGLPFKTLCEARTEQADLLDKPFQLEGAIDLATYYKFGYEGTEQSHQAFIIRHGKDWAHAFMERSKADDLRRQISSGGMPLNGIFTVVLQSRRVPEFRSELLVELVDARLQLK